MATEVWYDRKLVGSMIIVLLVAVLLFYGIPYLQEQMRVIKPPKPPAYAYTSDLTVLFKVMDDTTSSLITADIKPAFYTVGTDPFSYTFVGSPIAAAAYDSVKGYWTTILDMGAYTAVVTDEATTKTKYPAKVAVSVPGTNETDMEVMLSPAMLHMIQRATPSITYTIYAYNSTSGAYDISVTNINVTLYEKWQIEYRFSIAGLNKIIKAGRLYLTTYTGLTVQSATLDGTPVSVYTDTDSSDDGLVGNYIIFPDWQAGTHYLTVYLVKTGSPSAGTYTLTLFEYYECLNPVFRWWTDETADISVVT